MGKFLQYMDGGKTDEKGISTHLAGLFQGEVINGLAVAQGSPLGMTVNVSKGRCMIDSGDDYPYLGFTDAIETVAITTADGSNPRIDAIVGYVDLSVVDSTNANNPDAFVIVAVPGTPAGSPNAPDDGAVESAIGLGNPFIRLAHVTVGTGVTTITNGNISDQRVIVSSPDDFIGNSQIKDEAIDTRTLAQSALDAIGSYSLTEVATPFTWIDGKTIYKKTVSCGALPNASSKTVAHGISGIDYTIAFDGTSTSSGGGGNHLPLNYRSATAGVWTSVGESSIGIATNTDLSTYTVTYITIYYTKV